jgi:hypothetical protein
VAKVVATYLMVVPLAAVAAVVALPTKLATSGTVPADCRVAKRDLAATFPMNDLSQFMRWQYGCRSTYSTVNYRCDGTCKHSHEPWL